MAEAETPTKPRPSWPRRLALIALAVVFLVLSLPFAANVAVYKSAPGFLWAQWRDPVMRPFGYQPAAFYRADRVKHAQFWLDQGKRLARDDRASAEALMGCAWLLHNLTQASGDLETEHHLWNTSLELAALATKREPGNFDWWRLRAWLAATDRWEPLDDDWMSVLAESAKHDPDNALYDYLAAYNIGWNAVRAANVNGRDTLVIEVPDKFEKARQCFEAGLSRPLMACRTDEISLILDFLEQSRQPRFVIADLYAHGAMGLTATTPSYYVYTLHERQLAGGDSPEDKAKADRNTLQMVNQCEAAGTVDWIITRMKVGALGAMWDNSLESATAGVKAEETQLGRQHEAAQAEDALTTKLLQYAVPPPARATYKALIPMILWDMTVRPIELLFVGALILGFASWTFRNQSQPTRFGAGRHVLAWLCGIGLSFFVFAILPAQILPDSGTLVLSAVVFFLPVAAVLSLPLFVLRSNRGRRSGLLLIASLIAILAIFGLMKWLRFDFHSAATTTRFLRRDPDLAVSLSSADQTGLPWAVAQWTTYNGLLVGVAISLTLVVVWYAWRTTRRSQQGFRGLWMRKPFAGWFGLSSTLARSMFGAAVCLLAIYLFLAPRAVYEVDFASTTLGISLRSMEAKPALQDAITKARGDAAALDRLLKQIEQGQLDPRAPVQ